MNGLSVLMSVLEIILVQTIIENASSESTNAANTFDESCYEMYENKDLFSCAEPRRKDNVRCVKHLKDGTYGLTTPSNETILFVPPKYQEERCFDIEKEGKTASKCDELNRCLTTPDNYTIWLENSLCAPLSKTGLKQDEDFVANATFDYRAQKCYKLYDKNEKISPYTCWDKHILDSCAEEVDNCSVITTRHKETVVMGCSRQFRKENTSCVDVLLPNKKNDNNKYKKICLEKLEERCVGFVTPSGLRILVACKDCHKDYLGLTLFAGEPPKRRCFELYRNEENLRCKRTRHKSNVRCMEYLGKNNYGLLTPTNETITFVHPSYQNATCFDIHKNGTVRESCSVRGPAGLRLTTPDNFTIWFKVKCNVNPNKTTPATQVFKTLLREPTYKY